MSENNLTLADIPSVTDCLNALLTSTEVEHIPLTRIKRFTRLFLDQKREQIKSGKRVKSLSLEPGGMLSELTHFICSRHEPNFTPVVNGTGVIIHTNLGRSLLPQQTIDAISVGGSSYSNLEFDLQTGGRGSRYRLVEDTICEITGAEAALVVNNNAAAVLLVLDTFAKGKEVIVSRGQLVEIGGSFRIPDVMTRSGAKLVEVGATNRTHLVDYEHAITDETAMLLKVHCSNYQIIGFTSEVDNKELSQLGKKYDIPVVEDLGSGCLVDLSGYELEKEPTVQEVVASGVDLITFSGDKLLGGPQAGVIVGKKKYIEKIKRNPLNRALRIDKFTLIGLESILRFYFDIEKAFAHIPTLKMIADPVEHIENKVKKCLTMLGSDLFSLATFEEQEVYSRVGGGAMPEQNVPSLALAIIPKNIKVSQMERKLRNLPVPIIGRVEDDKFLLDMRTVSNNELELVVSAIKSVLLKTESGASKC